MNIYILIAAKFLHAVMVTIVQVAVVKMINETVPNHKLSSYSAMVFISVGAGLMLCFGLGLGLPQVDYNPELPKTGKNLEAFNAYTNDKFWRYLLAFPVLINVLALIMFTIFIRKDSIMHNLNKANMNQADAMILINKVYHSCEDRDELLYALKT